MKTIYKTTGAAKEYCDYAVDIYTGCSHKCKYCYAAAKAEKNNEIFTDVSVRSNIVAETKRYLDNHKDMVGKTVFLGFSSDAFVTGIDHKATIDMIKMLKAYGCNVMFCTKGKIDAEVVDLLDNRDSVGITITCGDDMAAIYESDSIRPSERIVGLKAFYDKGIETWVSIEPVLDAEYIYNLLMSDNMKFISKVKLGKLNHMNISDLTGNESDNIDWSEYATKVKNICEERNITYILKNALAEYLDAVFLYEKVRERGHYECYRYKGVEIYSNLNYEWEWSIEDDDGDDVWFASLNEAKAYIDELR